MPYNPGQFIEKYKLALEAALKQQPQGGLCGFELEWNLLDQRFHPLLTVGKGPSELSFVDFLRAECIHPALRGFSQLEVFHWMIEWATRPYYSPRATIFEARLIEASMINALDKAGRKFGERLYYWHGNLPYLPNIDPGAIPGSWGIAKRRYLERCVDLYGHALATAGLHTNLSMPEPLLAWDFMHLPATERLGQHLDDYKSSFYITVTRLLRAFSSLFIATSASTPFQAQPGPTGPRVVLTEFDSIRNLTFPNPVGLDVPNLYRSYDDYLKISYELVRNGLRFGNNNWTPVRARSFAEPVERLIAVTSEQLADLYARGLYAYAAASHGLSSNDSTTSVDDMARQIEKQNLMARINLPMSRVEVRSDDGAHQMSEEIALLTLKHLLMLRFYADSDFGRSFRYDAEDIARARRNEDLAARYGMQAEIENPFTAKPVKIFEFLAWILDEIRPLAEALGLVDDLEPLNYLAGGGRNASGKLRDQLSKLGIQIGDTIPLEILTKIAKEREELIEKDVEEVASHYQELEGDGLKLGEFIQRAREAARADSHAPVRFRPRADSLVDVVFADKTSEVLALAEQLVRIPSVTACPEERLDEVRRAGTLIYDYARAGGLEVRFYDYEKYPSLLIGFPGQITAPFMLSGHFDVVEPEPDDRQFEPHIDGDYFWGRGAADMKTVVATNLVWMKDIRRKAGVFPKINMMLLGNEENGEMEPMGTPHMLRMLAEQDHYAPDILVAGERTGEKGNELFGEVCIQNRGVMRVDILASGAKGHSGVAGASTDLTEKLLTARTAISDLFRHHLTLASPDGWQSQARFPFIQVGTPGVYNVTPGEAIMGIEIRSIPQDNLTELHEVLRAYCDSQGLTLRIGVMENGISCDPENQYLKALLKAVEETSGQAARVGKKLPGTSARFAPHGQGVVWGQTGIGPHSKEERHFIPSILPYYNILVNLVNKL